MYSIRGNFKNIYSSQDIERDPEVKAIWERIQIDQNSFSLPEFVEQVFGIPSVENYFTDNFENYWSLCYKRCLLI